MTGDSAGNDRINLVAMVENEYRRPLFGEVVFAEHIEVHSGRGQQNLAAV